MEHELTEQLLEFVRNNFLNSDGAGGLTPTTPLLEWGILTSMNTAILLNHIREEYGVSVPPQEVTGRNLASIETIVSMLVRVGVRVDEGVQA